MLKQNSFPYQNEHKLLYIKLQTVGAFLRK